MRLIAVALFVLGVYGSPATAHACTPQDVAPLLNAMFSSLGHDCPAYVSLFGGDAQYFHQHDGYKTYTELLGNCQNYAQFCPGNGCKFVPNGLPTVVARGNSCHILVPYLWSELPANHKAGNNLEPHTGWEYIVADPTRASTVGYAIRSFAEIESSYSMAFNWADPANTPAVVAQSTWYLLSLKNSASKGECNGQIAPTLTKFFASLSNGQNLWRQQGDAVVLAAGGLCHVAVPYAAQIGAGLKTGHIIFTLQPAPDRAYVIRDAVEFPQPLM